MAELKAEGKGGLLSQAQHYWHVLLKWKWMIAIVLFAGVAGSAIYSLSLTPIYVSSGSVWIEEDPNILPFEEVQSFGAGKNMQSHARLLKSKALAADTVDRLKLYENPAFAGEPGENGTRPDPDDPIYRELLVQRFIGLVSVSASDRTRLIDVSFASPSPQLSMDALNALFESYIDMIVKKRYSATEQAAAFLDAQINELRTEIEARERELAKMGSERDFVPLTPAEAPTVSRLASVNSELTSATIDRINKFNAYNQLKNAPLGEIPDAPSGSLVERLRERYVTLRTQYASRLASLREDYPEMRRLKSELDSATEALQNETQNLIRSAENDYRAALDREQSLKKLLDQLKTEAYKVSGDSVMYNSMRIELENRKSLLESLAKRKSETDISSQLKGLEGLNVWIVDKADFPISPAYPNKRKNVMMGFLVGLAAAAGMALGVEYLNNTVKTSKDVAAATGLPTIGAIPLFDGDSRPKTPWEEFRRLAATLRGQTRLEKEKPRKKRMERGRRRKDDAPAWLRRMRAERGEVAAEEMNNGSIDLIVSREPASIQAETFRSIRTTLLVSSPPGRVKSIAITSPLAQEGKSSIVSNLGITLAQANKQVVIIDADLRRPKQSAIFGLVLPGKDRGLTGYLSSYIKETEIIEGTSFANLFVIPSGPIPANPIELLTSDKMDILIAALKKSYDYILLDTPPLLAVSDTLAMGPMVDAVVIVARGGETPIPALRQAKQKLDTHKLRCLGVILNGVDLVEQDGYYAKQYSHYSKQG
jgi:polysaccharide biosynthesis transport protein